jgi:hypothetical protein
LSGLPGVLSGLLTVLQRAKIVKQIRVCCCEYSQKIDKSDRRCFTMADMDPNLAELSRSIDPAILGRRLRNARVAAGLTQTQAAGGDASTAYISRIEAGQRRPDLKLLARLADRKPQRTL